MKKYLVRGFTSVIYEAIIEAESQDEANAFFHEGMNGYELDDCMCYESCIEESESFEINEYEFKEWSIPFLPKKDGEHEK